MCSLFSRRKTEPGRQKSLQQRFASRALWAARSRGPGRQAPPAGATPAPPDQIRKEVNPVKFARACGGFAAVLYVGLTLALACDHLAALLDAALMI